jgi:hypothetical protein
VPGELAGSGIIGARATANLGESISRAGDTLTKSLLEQAEITNETLAKNGAMSAMEELTKAEQQYRSLRGEDAMKGLDAYNQQIAQIRQNALASMPNPMARRMLDQSAFRYWASGMERGLQHYGREQETWRKESAAGMGVVATNTAVANSDQPAVVADAEQKVIRSAQQLYAGSAPEFIEAKVAAARGDFWQRVLTDQAEKNPRAALALFNANRSKLDAQAQVQLQDYLTKKANHFESRVQVDADINEMTGGGSGGGGDFDRNWNIIEKKLESGGRQFGPDGKPLTSTAGAIGVAQVIPSTAREVAADLGEPLDEARYRNDEAYNRRLGQTYYRKMLARYNDPTLAAAAYNAGPGRVDEWIKANGDPRQGGVSLQEWVSKIPIAETRNYAAKFLKEGGGGSANAGTLAPPKPFNPDELRARILAKTEGNPELRDQMLAYGERRISQQNAQLHGARVQLDKDVENTTAALRDGAITAIDPKLTARVDGLVVDPAVRDGINQSLQAAQKAGLFMQAMQYASEADIMAMREAYATGNVSENLRRRVPTLAATIEGSSENYIQRKAIEAQINTAFQRRKELLDKDAASYVAGSPIMRGMFEEYRAAPKELKTEALERYNTQSLALQQQMGVAPDKRRLLSDQQVTALVGDLQKTGDMRKWMAEKEQQFGTHWPKVYGELVKVGNIPQGARVIADMDQPTQVQAAADYQRVLTLLAEPKGRDALEDQARSRTGSPTVKIDVSREVDNQTSGFAETAAYSSGGQQLIQQMRAATTDLAMFYMGRDGISASAAVKKASDGLINEKWQTNRTMIYPKDKEDAVLTATESVQASLNANLLAPPEPGMLTAMMRPGERAVQFDEIVKRQGTWVPNEGATGLVLMAPLSNGGRIPVQWANGEQVQILFNSLPATGGRSIFRRMMMAPVTPAMGIPPVAP